MSWFSRFQPMSDEEFRRKRSEILRHAPVPLFWMFGKTGSGKTSIIRYLTGAATAEIGNGFRPQTQFSTVYDFPSASAPLLRFMDTRGLGEANYQAQGDLDEYMKSAHMLIVTARVMDHALIEIIGPLREIRRLSPERPVLLALTCLHDAYPGQQHPAVDPFDARGEVSGESISAELRRSIEHHRREFSGLVDRIVPIDLTPVDEGFLQPNFGGDRLKQTILELLPAAYRDSLLRMEQTRASLRDLHQQRVQPVILGYSTLAASAAAVPLPWVDIPVVMGIQARLVYRLAELHQQKIDAATIARVSGAVGGRVALRMAVRELLKVIPWAGSTINAAASFAYTYATGMAWNWYFREVKGGHVPTARELNDVFREQLSLGANLWQVSPREG